MVLCNDMTDRRVNYCRQSCHLAHELLEVGRQSYAPVAGMRLLRLEQAQSIDHSQAMNVDPVDAPVDTAIPHAE